MRRLGAGIAFCVLVLGAATLPYLTRPRPERAPGSVPEPVAPFGVASRVRLAFHWTIPADDAPVRIEVFDADHRSIWRSERSTAGMYRPGEGVTRTWPLGDLFWRPVAAPEGAAERPGAAAAFTLAP